MNEYVYVLLLVLLKFPLIILLNKRATRRSCKQRITHQQVENVYNNNNKNNNNNNTDNSNNNSVLVVATLTV